MSSKLDPKDFRLSEMPLDYLKAFLSYLLENPPSSGKFEQRDQLINHVKWLIKEKE